MRVGRGSSIREPIEAREWTSSRGGERGGSQGLTFGPHGELYANEHGPKSDDELNLIEAGKNYGWPNVYTGAHRR